MRDITCKHCANLRNGWCEKVMDSPDPERVRDCAYYCEGKKYPCVYCTDDRKCQLYSKDGYESWRVLGPCESETPSHGDDIRQKTDEELAEFFGKLPCCPPGEDVIEMCFPDDSCGGSPDKKIKCWLQWLKQPSHPGRGGQK